MQHSLHEFGKERIEMGRQIAVIGGGAAGMMAAIQAAGEGAAVTVYEKNERVGKKILSTGNGRCNFSNEAMGAEFYHGSGTALADGILAAFGVVQTKAFFASLGMRIRDRDGYLYPASDQASTVLDLLRYELDRRRVTVHTGEAVRTVSFDRDRKKFGIGQQGEDACYDAVILSCGGRAAPNTGSDGNGFRLAERFGHRIVRPVPALAALVCKESFYRQVAGVRCDAALTLLVAGKEVCAERGELQLTDYGLSGIPAFQLCRTAAYALLDHKSVTVRVSFLPDLDEASCESFFRERLAAHGEDEMDVFLTGIVNKKINRLLMKLSGIRENERAKDVPAEAFVRLRKHYLKLETVVTGTNGFDRAQVCAGGVDCAEVTTCLMSKKQPGLYFAGEILDIDGQCGGYNLQWAWSSGTAAGRAAARKERL